MLDINMEGISNSSPPGQPPADATNNDDQPCTAEEGSNVQENKYALESVDEQDNEQQEHAIVPTARVDVMDAEMNDPVTVQERAEESILPTASVVNNHVQPTEIGQSTKKETTDVQNELLDLVRRGISAYLERI